MLIKFVKKNQFTKTYKIKKLARKDYFNKERYSAKTS